MKTGLILGSNAFAHGAIALDKYADTSVEIPTSLALPAYNWGMLGNDEYGDCLPAALFHCDESMYLRRGLRPYPYQTPEVLVFYFACNDVPPGPPGSSSDQGTDPSVGMEFWQVKGLPGHKILGFGQLPAGSPNVRRCIYEFGGVILAIALPDNWQSFVNGNGVANFTGKVTPDPNEGHGIVANGYTESGLAIVTWGEEGSADNPFVSSVLEQAFVPLSEDALNSAEVGPGGMQLAQMRSDLSALVV